MLHKQSIKEKLLKGSMWAFGGKVITVLASLATNALLARLLTPQEMGAYFLTLSVVSVAALVSQLGLTHAIVRLIAESMGTEQPARARMAVRLTLRASVAGALLVVCVLAFGGGVWLSERVFHSAIMSKIVGLIAVWTIIMATQQLLAEIFRGFHDVRLATIFGGLLTGIFAMVLFLGLWVFQGKSDLHQVIMLMLAAGATSVTLSSLMLGKKLRLLSKPKGNEIKLIELAAIAWPLLVTSFVLFVLTQVDMWIMGIFRPVADVATYGAASRMVALVTMPLLIANAVIPPIIAELNAQGKTEELELALRKVATITGVPALLAFGMFVFFGPEILGLIFGEYYQSGGIILRLLSLGQLANVWAGSCGLALMLTGYQSTMMFITIICGAVTVFLAWLLVQAYGGSGVAIAVASGMILQNMAMLLFVRKRIGIWTHIQPSLLGKLIRDKG